MTRKTPRLEFDLAKIGHNVRQLINLYGAKGIKTFMGGDQGRLRRLDNRERFQKEQYIRPLPPRRRLPNGLL